LAGLTFAEVLPRFQGMDSSLPSVSQQPRLLPWLLRGSVGGILLSLAGFVPWAFFGRPLTRALGEGGMYAVCAVVFILLSGPLLHRLLLGKKTLARFYALFLVSFSLYSAGWIAGWMAYRGHAGSLAGLGAGCLIMGLVFAAWFRRWSLLLPVVAILLVWQIPGYFVGGWAYGWAGSVENGPGWLPTVGRLLWGLFYGWGLGAGLGGALWLLQRRAGAGVN